MDKQTFSFKILSCQTKLYKVSMAMMDSYADAEDAASEAVARAWEKRDTLKCDEYFETWLIRILINVCRTEMRRKRRHPSVELAEDYPAPEIEDSGLAEILQSIAEKYRLPLVLHCALGMDIRNTARALRISENTARWRIHKGKELAKQKWMEANK